MKYAWVEDSKIRDIAPGNPWEFYHPDVAKFYDTQVPDEAANGDGWVNGQLVKPVITPPTPAPRRWTSADIRKGLTLVERVRWDNDTAPEIKTAKLEMEGEQIRAKTQEVLDLLVAVNVISQASADAILADPVAPVIPSTVT